MPSKPAKVIVKVKAEPQVGFRELARIMEARNAIKTRELALQERALRMAEQQASWAHLYASRPPTAPSPGPGSLLIGGSPANPHAET